MGIILSFLLLVVKVFEFLVMIIFCVKSIQLERILRSSPSRIPVKKATVKIFLRFWLIIFSKMRFNSASEIKTGFDLGTFGALIFL